jgi:5'-phosphate synthase pdxT subunit
MALLARASGLLDHLKFFIKTKPVWGTCAGAILLSQAVENAKTGGQELLGGMSITIARNGWGSQVILESSLRDYYLTNIIVRVIRSPVRG